MTYAVVAVVLSAAFVPMSIVRMVDSDEGTYLVAAKLVVQGKLLYRDVAYPEMPLLPYLYGPWMKVVGMSGYSARLLSAVFAVALGLILFRQIFHLTRDGTLAAVATVAFAGSGLGVVWYPVVKTFVFTTLMLFLSWAVLDFRLRRGQYVLSGFFLGLAVATRIHALVAIVPLAVELGRRERRQHTRRQLAWFAAGLGLALLPVLLLFLVNPSTFVFNVSGHSVSGPGGLGAVHDFAQKASTVLLLLTVLGSEGAISLQFTVLLFLNVAFVVSRLVMRERVPLSASMAGLLLLVGLLPTPTSTQYACIPLPFMVVNAALLVADIATALPDASAASALRRKLGYALAVLLALYILVAPVDFYRFIAGAEIHQWPGG